MIAARWLSPIIFAALSACSSPRLAPDTRPNPQLITDFLTYRGETSFDKRTSTPYPNVYVDDQPFGSISILQSIPASDVSTIRLYRSGEAMTKYGTGNAGGVIAISTRH